LLDEVGDIPLPVQVKLLRAIQSGEFERLGSDRTLRTDVRILAATHRDLEERIRAGLFREDLFWRLNVVSIGMPPLRARTGDIPLLVNHFLLKHADLAGRSPPSVAPQVIERLMRWPFSGNVRELENWIERAMALADEDALGPADFPAQLFEEPRPSESTTDGDAGLEAQVAALETSLMRAALEHHGGNKSAAARELKMTERAMRYKLRKYGL
jgi:DNA-binding NtrC family response regulator